MNHNTISSNKSFLSKITIFALVICVTLSFAEWLSFDNGQTKGSVTEADQSKCSAVKVAEMGCRVTVSMPGAFKVGPDARDERLLKGTTALSLYGSALEIVGGNFNGTLRPEKLGQPDLPYAHMQILIPTSVTMDQLSVAVENTNFIPVASNAQISPIQEALWESYYPDVHVDSREFQKDMNIYTTNQFFTHETEYDVAICHGYKFVTVKYCPVQYNPVTKELLATNTADIVLSYSQTPVHVEMKPNLWTNMTYRTTIDGITGKTNHPYVEVPRGGNFAIVSAGSLKNCQALKDYIAYRESQGHKHIETVDGSGGASSVASKLKSLYSSSKLDFVLVVGDDLVMKPPYGNGSKYHYKGWARLEGSDEYEDVMLGIFLCNNESGLKRIIQRQKWHEAGGSWTNTFLNTAGAEGSENPMARFSSGHYATRNFDKPNGGHGYKVNRAYQCRVIPTRGYGGKFNIPGPFPWESWVDAQKPWYTSGSTCLNKIYGYWNEGCFMLQHRDHGSKSGPGTPRIRMSSQVTTQCSPFFLSVNCLSGNFVGGHSSNFAYLTQKGTIGTCATLAAPPVTYSGDNDKYIMGLYAGMFPGPSTPPDRQLGMAHIYAHKKGGSHSRTYLHNYGDVMTLLSIGDMKPFISVTTPGGGEKVEQGSTTMVKWSDNISDNVKIELLKGGTVKKTLANSTASNGSFEWKVAKDLAVGDDYKVKITSLGSGSVTHQSEKNFSVIPEYILVCPYFQNFDTLEAKTEILPFKYEQLSTDDKNWTVYSGPTPSRVDDPPDVTGPKADHTTGQSGNYIYTEASASASGNPNKKFDFLTPKFNFKAMKNPELSFFYHMFSNNAGEDHMGELHLDISVDGTWKTDVFAAIKGNQGDAWKEKKLDLTPFKGERVLLRFRGITGDSWESDIGLDDIKIAEVQTGVITNVLIPGQFGLRYYNSRIHFSIPQAHLNDKVTISLYTVQGKMVKTLLDKKVSASINSVSFDSKQALASGMYHCVLRCKDVVKRINISHVK